MPSTSKEYFDIKKHVHDVVIPFVEKELKRNDLPAYIIKLKLLDDLTQFIRFEYVRRNEEYQNDWKRFCNFTPNQSGNNSSPESLAQFQNDLQSKWQIMDLVDHAEPLRFLSDIPVWTNILDEDQEFVRADIQNQYAQSQFSAAINLNEEYYGNASNYPPEILQTGYVDKFSFERNRGRIDWDKDKWVLFAINKNAPITRIRFEIESYYSHITELSKKGRKVNFCEHIKNLFYYDGLIKKNQPESLYKTNAEIIKAYENVSSDHSKEKNFSRHVNNAKDFIAGEYRGITQVIPHDQGILDTLKSVPMYPALD